MSAQFSPFTSVTPSPAGWASGNSEPAPQGDVDMAWGHFAPPTRSMSYGGEPLANNHPAQYSYMDPSRQFERRPSALSDAYTASMGGMVPGFEAGTSTNMNTAISFPDGAVPPTNYTIWDQSQPYPNYTYMKNQNAYDGGWSHENRGRDHTLQVANPNQQAINHAVPMNVYQTR
ncbi:hypothetical protein FSARC_9273 [Fusarium sarcochroum]|uniref:Uncharacterized protein n=1 Tax=Fusarium sarcochroum TaxID=1208366 RepID=A0A8H4TRQ5_9HYPO|nr:hypothetical protein FSARC_9273 [Fusarium sarcochroum]